MLSRSRLCGTLDATERAQGKHPSRAVRLSHILGIEGLSPDTISGLLDLSESYMIGDKLSDLECGWNAGVKKCLLVRTGYGAELERSSPEKIVSAVIVDNLPAAVEWIVTFREENNA